MRIGAVLFVLLMAAPTFAKDKYLQAKPIHLDHKGEQWAEKTLRGLSTEEKIGQLFMVWVRAQYFSANSAEYLQLRDLMHKYHLGSFAMTVPYEPPFLYRSQPFEAADVLNRLQKDSKLPLLFAADFERGASIRIIGATEFPHAMAFGAAGSLSEAEAFGRITAEEARAIGVHWNFFPDADVNSNPANPIINTRSFGEDPQQVSDLVAAYIHGARQAGMLTTAKHFPGHGDTATDSHLGLAQVTGDRARLNSVELAPFRKAVEAGVDAVMVAHVTVPALEPDPSRVATTSSAVVTDLLKRQLGFQGIVVTDALDMAGLTRLYAGHIGRAAVESFKAGNDLLIIPADIDASFNAMVEAVRSGEIPQAQLDASVLKILKAKASVGLNEARLVDVAKIPDRVGATQNLAIAQQAAEDAITLVRSGKVLPLKQAGTVEHGLPYQRVQEVRDRLVAVIFSDDVRTESGRMLERQIRARVPDVRILYVDPRIAGAMTDPVLQAVDHAEAVIAAVYMIPTAGRMARTTASGPANSVSLTDASGDLLQKILDHAADKTAVLAMGNPYLAADFPAIQNYVCAFSNASVSEAAVVRALFGEIPIRGHLPVSIPNVAPRGAGIERATASPAPPQ